MRDLKTEDFLAKGGWTWKFVPRVSFSEIDIPGSEQNPARSRRQFDESRANRYMHDMKGGQDFPGIVLLNHMNPLGKIKYIIATGVHRLKGAQWAGKTALDAYIVTEPDEYRRHFLTLRLNYIEGVGNTRDEDIQAVIELHERWPDQSLMQLAEDWGLTATTVRNAYAVHKFYKRAIALGFSFSPMSLHNRTAMALQQIPSDVVFIAACEMVRDFQNIVLASEVRDMVNDIKAETRGEKEQLEIVEKQRKEVEEREKRNRARWVRQPSTAITRLMGTAKSFNRQLQKPLDQIYVASYTNAEDGARIISTVIDNANKLLAEFQRIHRARMSGSGAPGAPASPMAASPRRDDE